MKEANQQWLCVSARRKQAMQAPWFHRISIFVFVLMFMLAACTGEAPESPATGSSPDATIAEETDDEPTEEVDDEPTKEADDMEETNETTATVEEEDLTSAVDEDATAVEENTDTENTASADNASLLLALGASDNRLSVLTPDGWIQPDINLRGCLDTGSVLFSASGQPWVGCFDLATSTDGGQTWNIVDTGGDPSQFSLGERAALDNENYIWFVTNKYIAVLNADDASIVATYTPTETTGEEQFPGDTIAFSADGTVWLGGQNISGSELVSFDGETWQTYGEPEDMGVESFASPDHLAFTNDGELVVFAASGAYTLDGTTLTPFIDESADLPMEINNALFMPDGSIWMASLEGIFVWDGSTLETIDHENGLPSDNVHQVALDAEGRVWAATNYGLAVQDDNGGWEVALPSTSGLAESRLAAVGVQGAPTLPSPEEEQTATVSGRVVFNGEPVANTTVQLCNENGKTFFQETPCEDLPLQLDAQTDTDGTFIFENVPIGTLGLTARRPDGEWVIFLSNVNALNPGQEVTLGDVELSNE
jgi:hypothetical protein